MLRYEKGLSKYATLDKEAKRFKKIKKQKYAKLFMIKIAVIKILTGD